MVYNTYPSDQLTSVCYYRPFFNPSKSYWVYDSNRNHNSWTNSFTVISSWSKNYSNSSHQNRAIINNKEFTIEKKNVLFYKNSDANIWLSGPGSHCLSLPCLHFLLSVTCDTRKGDVDFSWFWCNGQEGFLNNKTTEWSGWKDGWVGISKIKKARHGDAHL